MSELEQALQAEAAAQAALVSYYSENPDIDADARVRHLVSEVEAAQRRTIRAQAREEGLALRARRLEQAAQEEAEAMERQAREQFRADCLALLPGRELALADSLGDWLVALIGSGQAHRSMAGNPQGWLQHLARAGYEIPAGVLHRVAARDLS